MLFAQRPDGCGSIRRGLIRVCLAVFVLASVPLAQDLPPKSPSELFPGLYAAVELANIFPDSKTFTDAIPRQSADVIMTEYNAERPQSSEELAAFVGEHFDVPSNGTPSAVIPARLPLKEHIAALWPQLVRSTADVPVDSSQLAVSRPYVVPGGRFRELYYWDSYFTMLGLVRDGHRDLAADMVDDFAELIAQYGHVPNGTRTYYLSRSQPPFFYLMVGLTSADHAGAYAKYLPALRREYEFWMHGENQIASGAAIEHVVKLRDGAILNRYWDARDVPRDESYREDVAVAKASGRPGAEVYRELRSAAESGWDFSSRWLADGRTLATIETTHIIPVDLNSLLFGLEGAIEEGCARLRDRKCVLDFQRRAAARKAAVTRYLWDATSGTFRDYQWSRGVQLNRSSAAMMYPLFVGLATHEQAAAVANAARHDLLAPGGLRTTTVATGQQWDAPNGWAPLQWIAVTGLNAYNERALAGEIAARWLGTVSRMYAETGKLVEKYDVETTRPGGGGEYPLQDGFGWTNGVTRALMDLYPQK